VTVENSKTAPPGTKVEQNVMAGAMVPVDDVGGSARRREVSARELLRPRSTLRVHSSEENFRNPYYGRVTFLAYFTGACGPGTSASRRRRSRLRSMFRKATPTPRSRTAT